MRLIILVLGLVAICYAQLPDYDSPYFLECAGSDIDVGYYGAPCVTDWDGDGLKDLILGQFTSGKIRFYSNEGTNSTPVFNSFSYLKADGSAITLPSG